MKVEVKGAVPCSICGEMPILQGGYGESQHAARLACPNYKNSKIPHGNCSPELGHLPRGFTSWHHEDWWTKEQAETMGMPKLVNVWNIIHTRHETEVKQHD